MIVVDPTNIAFSARGPASGAATTATRGASVARNLIAGRWFSRLSCSLRSTYQPIFSGSVLVTPFVNAGTSLPGGTALPNVRHLWEQGGYVSTGRGLVLYPNVYVEKTEGAALSVAVWSREALTGAPFVVDIDATFTDRPIPASDTGHLLGDYRPGSGTMRVVAGADPAADTNSDDAIPVGLRWRVLGIRQSFTTAAGGSTRGMAYARRASAGGAIQWLTHPIGHTLAGGITDQFYNAQAITAGSSSGLAAAAGPIAPLGEGVWLANGQSIGTAIVNLASTAGDNLGVPSYSVEEWVVPEEAA